MSQPEHEAIVNEIRSAQITASPELRARVRAIAAQSPAASTTRPPRRELPWRRAFLVLAPAAVAVALASTLAVGLLDSGGSSSGKDRQTARPSPTLPFTGPASDTVLPARAEKGGAASGGGATTSLGSGNLPATPGRAQLYDAELTLKIKDLSAATKQALRLTRDFHGYVRSVDYGSGTKRGSAYLVLRVPVGSVQEAIVEFSALGRILDQHVSIQDVQPTVDKRFRQMQARRDQITKLQAKLQDSSLTTVERAALADELVATQHALLVLQKQATALARQTSYATVELDLRQGDKAVVVPQEPSRIGQAFHRSGQILVDEARVLVYVLVVGAPLLTLLALAAIGSRTWRRRAEAHLLSR
jgi:Domain of unknown function (DUF4349)